MTLPWSCNIISALITGCSSWQELVADALSWLLENAPDNDDFLPYADSYAYVEKMQTNLQSPMDRTAGLESAVVFVELTPTDAYETFEAADSAVYAPFDCQYRAYAASQGKILRTSTGVHIASPKRLVWNLNRNDA
ncbi:hypothetical protein PspLS_09692 [Pyricularia sp. CBS 133598]|nr:hypothetical protein PspLS_09692 [Pyricularia sp. CBS 133598]